ncbi:hypothetical protein C8R46DRAFT_886392, partial [Mycena filopes]
KPQVQNMRAELTPSSAAARTRPHSPNLPYSPFGQPQQGPSRPHSPHPGEEDHQGVWAREEQQLMTREQDRTMESIAGTLTTLAQQAGLMGQEIAEHAEMLDDLECNLDGTDAKLSGAMRRMRKFLRQSEEKGSGWCIIILIIVVTILLLLIIIL